MSPRESGNGLCFEGDNAVRISLTIAAAGRIVSTCRVSKGLIDPEPRP